MIRKVHLVAAMLLAMIAPAAAQVAVGSVDTTHNLMTPNDKVVVERYDDPDVPNVNCYFSRAQTGGLASMVSLSTDPSRYSIACRAVGPVSMPARLPAKDSVFKHSASPLFKVFTVTRMVDASKSTLVYLATSSSLVDGSPTNSISAVYMGDAH